MNSNKIKMEDALSKWLLSVYKKGAISISRLKEQIYVIYKEKEYEGKRIERIRAHTEIKQKIYENYIYKLINIGIINKDKESDNGRFFLITPFTYFSHMELICAIYPYCYISYLSSMYFHGLTDRIPKTVYITSCDRITWKKKSISEISERIRVQESDDITKEFIPFFPVNNKILLTQEIEIKVSITKNYIEPKEGENGIRVQDIGDLFIDMLRKPNLCGGVEHVISVFKEYANTFQRKIISRTNIVGSDIDKARIGFMLNTILGIDSPVIESWKKIAMNSRGGSRKLVSSNDFSDVYNDIWNISINVEELEKYGKKNTSLG